MDQSDKVECRFGSTKNKKQDYVFIKLVHSKVFDSVLFWPELVHGISRTGM